jgi:hypothetical protein
VRDARGSESAATVAITGATNASSIGNPATIVLNQSSISTINGA